MNQHFRKICWMALVLILHTSFSAQAAEREKARSIPRSKNGEDLLRLAKGTSGERYQFAVEKGAKIGLTEDGKSFFILWYPNESAKEKPPVIASIHGHGSFAFDEFYLWYEAAKKRGYGILALQWWLGGSESPDDYLTPNEIYRTLDQTFRSQGIHSQSVLLHGFSRGSANSYAVTAMDVFTKNRYFALTVANSGGAAKNYPPNREIEEGRFGERPFEGTNWVMFAGLRDPNPDRDGVPAMERTADWVKSYGGKIEKVIEDPNSSHGGFHRNPANMNEALNIFDQILHESQ